MAVRAETSFCLIGFAPPFLGELRRVEHLGHAASPGHRRELDDGRAGENAERGQDKSQQRVPLKGGIPVLDDGRHLGEINADDAH